MRHIFSRTFAGMAMVAVTTEIHAAEPHISREAIEWCNIWIPEYLR